MSNILVTRSSMPSLDEYVDEIKDIWDSHWLTNMGVKHKELQKELEDYFGIPHVTLYRLMTLQDNLKRWISETEEKLK